MVINLVYRLLGRASEPILYPLLGMVVYFGLLIAMLQTESGMFDVTVFQSCEYCLHEVG